jgi:hypothetical protein
MARRQQSSAAPGDRVTQSEAEPAGKRFAVPGANVSESFRDARSALGQISSDLERLRQRAASLVKGTHRTAR